MTWTEKNGTHTAKAGGYTLTVWQTEQYRTFGWTLTRGHIIKAGDAKTLEEAQSEAEAATNAVSQS